MTDSFQAHKDVMQFLSQARAMRSALVKRLYCAVCAVFMGVLSASSFVQGLVCGDAAIVMYPELLLPDSEIECRTGTSSNPETTCQAEQSLYTIATCCGRRMNARKVHENKVNTTEKDRNQVLVM